MSSKYTIINLPMNTCKTWFINLINVPGAFVSPNNKTNHSYKPCLVLNVVFHSSFSFILIWWYSLFKLVLEKIHVLYISSNMSSSIGIRCLYFTGMLLTARQSTHILQVSSFLGTNNTGTAQWLILSRMYPFIINSSTCL
jgi:hypothetical protein